MNRKNVYGAENNNKTTNIVVVLVDKDIYKDILTNLIRYTTKYIQKKIANSKAIILPIDTTTMKAHEISQILENIYFEGIKDENSKLIGTILIGNIPLPVVENNGFVYPSIYPYVDFEEQQFIYDTNKNFFVNNENPNGQAEIWHGLITFDTKNDYNTFFTKVRNYYNHPTTFIDKAIWYEDFIGLKTYYIPENTKYYVNSMIFAEDIGYHRFNNLMVNILQKEHNSEATEIGNNLEEGVADSNNPELIAYAKDIEERNREAKTIIQDIKSNMPTLSLKTATQNMLKGYDGLFSPQFLSKIKDNIAGLARRYKNNGETTSTAYSSLTDKIIQKDSRIVGDIDNNIQPVLIQINDFLENELNKKIEEEKYYMTIPMPVSMLEYKGKKKGIIKKKCTRETYNYYENYYFGKNANIIQTAQDTSIYKGTYKNLTEISNQDITTNPLQSIGGSYDMFSVQIEANRGYDINSSQEEVEKFEKLKTNKKDLWKLSCNNYFLGWESLNICLRKRVREPDDNNQENKCILGDTSNQGGCEPFSEFTKRLRGGASPMNIDAATQKLNNYFYQNATLPIYSIAGSKKIDAPEIEANSYQGTMEYSSMIQKRMSAGDIQYGNTNILSLIKYPTNNGSPLIFPNEKPVGNLNNPQWTSNQPKPYTQTNFFNTFSQMQSHTIVDGKAIVYTIGGGECGGNGTAYTYKTIDSRVKNTSPTRNQINNTEFLKFQNDSDINIFYTNIIKDIQQTQTDIETQTLEFSGSTNTTGIEIYLSQIKTTIATINNGLNTINNFNPSNLNNYSTGQIITLANTRSGNNINQTKIDSILEKINNVNTGLDTLLEYIQALGLDDTQLLINDIIQSEGLKNQKVEILLTQKNDIYQNLNTITNKINNLKTIFTQTRGKYNTIGDIQDMNTLLTAKKNAIHQQQICGTTPNTYACGCTNNYQILCTTIQNIQNALSNATNTSKINQQIDQIAEYTEENNQITKPFMEINNKLSNTSKITTDIEKIKNKINTFDISNDPNKKEQNKGMNLTTSDRPIDNTRNITFKGIGGDTIKLEYPNIYKIDIYKQLEDKLVLKDVPEIREAIKKYLIMKAEEYNTLLQAQQNKKIQYYNTYGAHFNFLGQLDILANPQNHTYNLIPTNYFIEKLIAFLDTLESGLGSTYVYGKNTNTDNEKIDMIAKLFYYQNISWKEKSPQQKIDMDITQTKDSFDINKKTIQVATLYLTENNNQGKFITPVYNDTGYEVGYINSDGEDFIQSQSTPSFIQQIQTAQNKTTTHISNNLEEDIDSTNLQRTVDNCEGVDTNGQALLFDTKTMSSPWMKAMKCWIKNLGEKAFDIKIGFKNAQGPVFVGIFEAFKESIDGWGTEWTEYGTEWKPDNNEKSIKETTTEYAEKLKGYEKYAIINLDKTIIGVDNTIYPQINVGLANDLGNIKIKITGTGDICFKITRGNSIVSENICNNTAEEIYNPNKENFIFTLIPTNKKSGSSSLKIQLCIPINNKDICITKQKVIHTIPGPIEKIEVKKATNIIIEGGELPLIINAKDKYNNTITKSKKAYNISVASGNGMIYDGVASNSNITFDDFKEKVFIYHAPIGLTENKNITLDIKPAEGENNTGAKTIQEKIIITKGIITIQQNNTTLYKTGDTITNTNHNNGIMFHLPKEESSIIHIDENNITQIIPENLPSIQIHVKNKDGHILDTVANIVSQKGLLDPGSIQKNTINANGYKTQIGFHKENNFIIKDGILNVTLYPNFKAGEDTLTINIPGIDPIIIPMVIYPGEGYKIIMELQKTNLDLTSNNISNGTIEVVDVWGNKALSGTKIKLGTLGAGKINNNEFIYNGNEYTYTLTAKDPGGEGFVFAYINNKPLGEQIPAYERFIIQESVLPKENLNIMYLNIFGTDRGNQRGYFSENEKKVNFLTSKSNKLLATTTELIDPNKIKQIIYIINPNGQIQSINNEEFTIKIIEQKILAEIPEVASIEIGKSNEFIIKTIENIGMIKNINKEENMMIYIPEPTDSIITQNKSTKEKITINNQDIINIKEGKIDQNIKIITNNETIENMNIYKIMFNDTLIGKCMFWNKNNIITNQNIINIIDPITYGKREVFSEGSTNRPGIGIFIQSSTFTKEGYASIENSTDAMLGIGFTNDFKNIANFANGKGVGESTLPYGSHFLINFGDPLLERRDKNPEITKTNFDGSIGETIYTDPSKSIFQTLPIDFNNDGLKDLLIIYTDGVIKLIKNYGGTHPYKNLQELMIIAEPIKEIKIGDVNNDQYDDIIILTTNNKGIVYTNNKGIFPVDGKNICLNTNTEPGEINKNPDDFSQIQQIFIKDMDQNGAIDIITLDHLSDIKIFYGKNTSNGMSYISSTTGVCDNNRYERQKDNYKTIKRFGVKINNDRYIQDESIVHRKGISIPTEGEEEEIDEQGSQETQTITPQQMEDKKNSTMEDIKSMINNTNTYIEAGSDQLSYINNPNKTAPAYETNKPEDIYYIPINKIKEENGINIYKKFVDINGGILRNNDEVVVETTITSLKPNSKLTYIDKLQGPRAITKNDKNEILSLVFSGNTGGNSIDRNAPEGYQFMIDNITLNTNETLKFSYKILYQDTTPIIHIDVDHFDYLPENKTKDIYPDIKIQITSTCEKDGRTLFNDKTNKKSYENIFRDVQSGIDTYNNTAQTNMISTLTNIIDNMNAVKNLEDIKGLPGLDNMESRIPETSSNLAFKIANTITNIGTEVGEGIAQGNISLNLNIMDDITKGIENKLDKALQGICQGFTLGGEGNCGGLSPIPFNQAFLAPGQYHLFGCVPKLPNPLYVAFKTLNETIGKGMPLLTVPGNRGPIPVVGYIPAPGIFGFPFKGATDNFFLGITGGPYPSRFRLYLAPTLTLGLGIAMCFGPYTIGEKIPKLIRDLGGNCVVFAMPPLQKTCNAAGTEGPHTETLDENMLTAAGQGTCNNPPSIGKTKIDNTFINTAVGPISVVSSFENTCESCTTNFAAAFPQGKTFAGLLSIEQDPITITSTAGDTNVYNNSNTNTYNNGYTIKPGAKIKLKVLGGKTKGLIKSFVQDWMGRQIKYIQNNLTRMTIQIDLPNMTDIFKGLDSIGNLEETYKSLNTQSTEEGYIKQTDEYSIQQTKNLSKTLGENPFKAIQEIFKEVPLVQIESKDINLKIPLITSDDVNKYSNYLTLRLEKNIEILENWTQTINKMLAKCGTIDHTEAKETLLQIEQLQGIIKADEELKNNTTLDTRTKTQIIDMNTILATENKSREDMADEFGMTVNGQNAIKKSGNNTYRKIIQTRLQQQKEKKGKNFIYTKELENIDRKIQTQNRCIGLINNLTKFIKFRDESEKTIRSVKQNIQILEKYKTFPIQLYEWTHLSDRYLTELSALLSNFVGGINSFMSINATRMAGYVDAITTMIASIKSRQAIIDLSVNRSTKCSKCSNDNYGAFSCSLSFLCPKLPIFPIPPFKIPNIYMDLSHIELGMNITLPKINFVPIKIPLPQLPNIPEPPEIEADINLNIDLNLNITLPTIPIIPEPPQLPEPPSFIPSIKLVYPILPPAPKIPKLIPEINAVLKVGEFIAKVFCIVKGGIGLVGEKGVKGKIEQITQRTWNVPIFDYFDLTSKTKDPPLQGFDYKIDAYTTLKFNFDGVYDVFNNIAKISNNYTSKVEGSIQKAVQQVDKEVNNNTITDVLNEIDSLEQNINVNVDLDAYTSPEETGLIDYKIVYNKLRQGLMQIKNSTISDKKTNNNIKRILAIADNQAKILPATKEIEQVEKVAQKILDDKIQENKKIQAQIKNYDTFIQQFKDEKIVLVSNKTITSKLMTPLLKIDTATKKIIQSQEDPTKTYLTINKQLVEGYLNALNNDGAKKLNMSKITYSQSKKYLETTKKGIDNALLGYNSSTQERILLAQSTSTTPTTSQTENSYSPDISTYVKGIFVSSYEIDTGTNQTKKAMINTVISSQQSEKTQDTYINNIDINNDKKEDIIMYDTHNIYIKYAKQENEHYTKGGSEVGIYNNKFYSYANEHTRNRYISSLDQIKEVSNDFGYIEINDIEIKMIEKNKEVKNFKTSGQSFDSLQFSWKNSKLLGEAIDGYILKMSKKIDDKDTPNSFRNFLGEKEKSKYILVLPQGTNYKKSLITIDKDFIKKPINLEIDDNILAIEYYDPEQQEIKASFKDLPRERIYINIAGLTITQEDLTKKQQESFTLYKKTSPRSNQTVAGMQNISDIKAPIGNTILRREYTNTAISSGFSHEGLINTHYTLKSTRFDDIIVKKIIIERNGIQIKEVNNYSQTGIVNITGLFYTGMTEDIFHFTAIDQNGNIAQETANIHIKIPDIEIIDLKKNGEETTDIIAKISNDIDEGLITFQRLRNGVWKDINGTMQTGAGGFELSPLQTIITGGIFTIGNEIGLYDDLNNEIVSIDPKTGELKIKEGFEDTIRISIGFSTHIPVIEIKDLVKNKTLFQIILPIEQIEKIQMNETNTNYQLIHLPNGDFGDFNNGYCIKNAQNDCVTYTNQAGAIYIPGVYAYTLIGEYQFDTTKKQTKFLIKDQSNIPISTLIIKTKKQ